MSWISTARTTLSLRSRWASLRVLPSTAGRSRPHFARVSGTISTTTSRPIWLRTPLCSTRVSTSATRRLRSTSQTSRRIAISRSSRTTTSTELRTSRWTTSRSPMTSVVSWAELTSVLRLLCRMSSRSLPTRVSILSVLSTSASIPSHVRTRSISPSRSNLHSRS